jgi:two-component system NarL family sensor kinase
MYRAAQEAISNIARHSRATALQMSLEPRGQVLVLTLRDNGVGVNLPQQLSSPASVTSGIGIRSIREQAETVGGRIVIESGPGGTKLEIIAPYVRSSELNRELEGES